MGKSGSALLLPLIFMALPYGMQQDFTCCVGSGMESDSLHGYGI